MVGRKIGEYLNDQFCTVYFSNTNIYGKIMFSVNSSNNLRVHLFKDIPKLQEEVEFEYGRDDLLDEIPDEFILSKKIMLKVNKSNSPENMDAIGLLDTDSL